MVREIFNKYPDYLQEFSEIAALESWQWRTIREYIIEIERMQSNLLIEFDGFPDGQWVEIVDFPADITEGEALRKLHNCYEVTTLEVLRYYISCWIHEAHFKLAFDKETMTLTVKVTKSRYHDEYYYRIRNVVPCNMLLVVELVEKLD